jgi:pyruvate dehydrogenase E1 component
VVPDQKIKKFIAFFEAAGWHVVEAKFGSLLTAAFARPGGELLRNHIEQMSNERYQSLFAFAGAPLRKRFLADASPELASFLAQWSDDELAPLVQNLGGHDLGVLREAFRRCDEVTDRPSVVFAYTVKGWGLPIAGDPLNHAALLSGEQIDELRRRCGLTPDTEWSAFAPDTPEGRRCASVGASINNRPPVPRPSVVVPSSVGQPTPGRAVSTQETFGRLLVRLADDPEMARRMVTVSPDVSVSTSLGGWINKMGVFNPSEQPDFLGDGRLLRWKQRAGGHHLELGISEMNLFLALHALGLAHELHGELLLPVGTVYDPFVCRGLDALIYALYNGARFVVVGTPAGVTLAPEGGAHQSSITPSIGLELPGLSYAEPAFTQALDWLLCDGLQRLARPDGDSLYLRLSTRPVDQSPFERCLTARGAEALRADVLAGGYRLREPGGGPAELVLATCGPVVPEVLHAAHLLELEGVRTLVLDLTSPDRLYRGWRSTTARAADVGRSLAPSFHLARLLTPAERRLPIVTVHDAASHHLAWLGGVFGARVVAVGVDEFGQSGTIPDLYRTFGLASDQIVNAGLVAIG